MPSSGISVTAAAFALSLIAPPSFAHDFWINHGHYRSPADNSHCCGDNDCFVLPASDMHPTDRRLAHPLARRDHSLQRGADFGGRSVLALQAARRLAPLLLRPAAFDLTGRDAPERRYRSVSFSSMRRLRA